MSRFLYEEINFSSIPLHGTIYGKWALIQDQTQKNRISSSQHLMSFIHKSGNLIYTKTRHFENAYNFISYQQQSRYI